MNRTKKFLPEARQRAVRLVFKHKEEHKSQWKTTVSIVSKIGFTLEALRKWVRQVERDQGERAGLMSSERERLKELERENRELKRAIEILRNTAAFLPHTKLDR